MKGRPAEVEEVGEGDVLGAVRRFVDRLGDRGRGADKDGVELLGTKRVTK
jgi:hypothetical protein